MEEELKLLGLSDVDVKVYLTLLQIGESSASDIAKHSNIPRTSVYDILERLEQEGLVSYIIKDFKKYFFAAEPKTIIQNLESTKDKITKILPELEKLKNKNSYQKITTEVYTGKKGIQTILGMILEDKSDLYVLGGSRKSTEILPFSMGHWHKERIKRKIKVRMIYNDIPSVKDSLKKPEVKTLLGIGKGWDYKFLHTDYPSPVMTVVFGGYVVLINWEEDPSAILINDEVTAKTYKQYILNLWKIAKR